MKLYSLLDKKAGTFGGVMLAMNDGHMGRFLQERYRGSQDTVEKYPGDFDLYEVGEFDVYSGMLSALNPARFVVNLSVILMTTEGTNA